jgi:pyrimidine deaminase RibD-like protein
MNDEAFMRIALELAARSAEEGEVHVGCVITLGNRIVGEGRNRRETGKNALCHAELEAIDMACRTLGGLSGVNTIDKPIAVVPDGDDRGVTLLSLRSPRTGLTLITMLDGEGITVAQGNYIAVTGWSSSDISNHSTGVDLRLEVVDCLSQRVDLLLQLADVVIVVRTRYGYPCETQNEGPGKEQIFDFFVHS